MIISVPLLQNESTYTREELGLYNNIVSAVKSTQNVCTGLLSLALFAVLQSVCQCMKYHVGISLLTVVPHQSNPYHLMKGQGKSTVYENPQSFSSMIQRAVQQHFDCITLTSGFVWMSDLMLL